MKHAFDLIKKGEIMNQSMFEEYTKYSEAISKLESVANEATDELLERARKYSIETGVSLSVAIYWECDKLLKRGISQ